MAPKWKTFLFEKSVPLWENVIFLDLFASPKFWTISFLHYLTALPISDTICSFFPYILYGILYGKIRIFYNENKIKIEKSVPFWEIVPLCGPLSGHSGHFS